MGFSHRGFFHAGVWAHPAKSLCVWPPLCVCVCVVGEVHGCYMWLGFVEVEVVSLCGCGCLQACTTTLNQFSVMGGGGEGGRGAVDNGWEGGILLFVFEIHQC